MSKKVFARNLQCKLVSKTKNCSILDKSFLKSLAEKLEGELQFDALTKTLYATDASVYRKTPLAVCLPKSTKDIQTLVQFAMQHHIGLIPRTAGTSLAGQCVGDGIVMDLGRYLNSILHLDVEKKQVTVQPGVVRDELNRFLEPHGLFFGPNTSTANRCMIGGMVGNNSSGTTSIQYGVTRDKVVSMRCVLSDASEVVFGTMDEEGISEKTRQADAEGAIYGFLKDTLSKTSVQEEIKKEFPKPQIHRRNTGYAIDELLTFTGFGGEESTLNLCELLSGSEGTLAITTEIKLQLDALPPKHAAMVCTHYETLEKCLSDVAPVMQHSLHTCEMMDKVILDCTKNNRAQLANRFFVDGDPAGILMLEVKAHDKDDLKLQVEALLKTIKKSGNSYASPVLYGGDIAKAIELRKAGLGLLGNMVGDKKAVACIEDTAVALEDLKSFIGEFTKIMEDYGQSAVYYAHAGAGELHLRPILDLKKSSDVQLFRAITTEVAHLTKKYQGSFSGEHGDGIVRAEFIPVMIGEQNYEVLKELKKAFDPKNIFNPGKIVDAFPMDESLRYTVDRKEPEVQTLMDFSDSQGILRAAEKCNGSGDCRKSAEMKGGMCPSYHATKNEKDTTRARANALREFLTQSDKPNQFDHQELKNVFDLCLSCKACASECPSNVDVATLKAEFQYQYQETNGYSLRSKLFAHNTKLNRLGSSVAPLTNAIYDSKPLGNLLKGAFGVAKERNLPHVKRFNFDGYLQEQKAQYTPKGQNLVLYIDEFTRYMDVEVGKDAIELLTRLGYQIELFYAESGRTYISKGFLRQAKTLALQNIKQLEEHISHELPILGLEPSAILTFRDEYQRLVPEHASAQRLKNQVFLVEEFLAGEVQKEHLGKEKFTKEERKVKIHGHCHQKALSNQKVTFDVLNLPENYSVTIIPSGCCGMAGSFGYEKEHYEVSMQVGELKLFPAVRKSSSNTIISANGTSCRHQIFDGTQRVAKHPVSILREALVV